MFIVLLKFSDNRDQAGQFMDDHKTWLQQGFDEGIFLLAGGLQPGLGGAVLARESSMELLQERVNADPFVAEKVVTAEIMEVSPSKADERLMFLLD